MSEKKATWRMVISGAILLLMFITLSIWKRPVRADDVYFVGILLFNILQEQP